MAGEDLKLEFEDDEEAKDELPQVDLEFSVSQIDDKLLAQSQASEKKAPTEKESPVTPSVEQSNRSSFSASKGPAATGSKSLRKIKGPGTRTIELRNKLHKTLEDSSDSHEILTNSVDPSKVAPIGGKQKSSSFERKRKTELESSFLPHFKKGSESAESEQGDASKPMKLREFRVKAPGMGPPREQTSTQIKKEKMQKANIRNLSDIDPKFDKNPTSDDRTDPRTRVRLAVAESKVQYVAEIHSEIKIAEYKVIQLLKKIYQRNPDLKKELVEIKAILTDLGRLK